MGFAGKPEQASALACELMQQGRFEEAIEGLTMQLRAGDNMTLERLLAECRYRAYVQQPPVANPKALRNEDSSDLFAGVGGVPEIQASQLNAHTLAAGIRYHGALLVRGLLTSSVAGELAEGIRLAIDACAEWHQTGQAEFTSPWYARLPLEHGCDIANARPWVEGAGGVWTADSPRLLHALTAAFDRSGVVAAIEGYFGERPVLSVGKSTLRCVPATQREADWHQDGAFMGTDIRSVNLWLSLSHCGEDASGLEFLPKRLDRVLPTGSHGANFEWSVGPGMVSEAAGGIATMSPRFAPGDALLFDHYFLHRTGVPAGICKDRYAVESWFFAPSAYPAQQVPLRL